MAVRIVQLGSDRHADEGTRIGTVRRPPRGVPKTRFARDNWYDVWLPELAPSAELLAAVHKAGGPEKLKGFFRRYESELKRPEASRLLDTLAALSHSGNFSVGCYCDDEKSCHRSVLRRQLEAKGALLRD